MDDKLIHIPNDDKQNNPNTFNSNNWTILVMNKVSKLDISNQCNIRLGSYKTSGTSVIYSPLSL